MDILNVIKTNSILKSNLDYYPHVYQHAFYQGQYMKNGQIYAKTQHAYVYIMTELKICQIISTELLIRSSVDKQ